jgi:D-3-phosphoglycerate dehydrogenase
LTSAFCVGLLERALEDVNIINAEMLLRERGIELGEQLSHEMGAFSSSMNAVVSGQSRSVSASGTVFGHDMPRLIMLGDYRLEAYIDGIMLIFTHHDVPGIIGKVGTIFGKHSVNIAQMSVGRGSDQAGGQAVGVLNLDSSPSEACLREISSVEGIETVHCLTLPPAGSLPTWLQ